ncbi:FAD-dependent oxidoreductase [Marinobacterium zhoushanense]|uniref:FAD-dependent oxidoreductase n=1 Tax=Marinobacterium zhoushanense TaxID=1679163 RepID=A0ABQ1KCQ8_9GAMM|nr:FAD-dependent oxidoreductase [Marinobacterium zhoushanense]GGB95370.1 FAD-dependent oxidoreductase [Marinobacterium zhoushanense]
MRIKNVAIIGSGIAGMRAAQLLKAEGYAVTVFEKSRGTGGRLASAPLGDTSVDLGCAMVEATAPEFERWLIASGAQPWRPRCSTLAFEKRADRSGWVGVPRSSSLTRHLADGVELRTATTVSVVWPDREGVLLRDNAGEALGHFDAAVVAAPAPQATKLLDAIHRFRQQAEQVAVVPVWTLLVSLASRPARLSEIDWLEGGHPVIGKLVRDSSKPQRQGENWVIQATEAWSQANVNQEPSLVATDLRRAFDRVVGETPALLEQRVHRWLYARAEPGQNRDVALWDEQSGIGACGDWLCGGDVEGAWCSANELVARILASRSKVA